MIRHFAEILPLRFGAQTDFFAAKSGQASLLRRTNRSSLVAEGVRTDCWKVYGASGTIRSFSHVLRKAHYGRSCSPPTPMDPNAVLGAC